MIKFEQLSKNTSFREITSSTNFRYRIFELVIRALVRYPVRLFGSKTGLSYLSIVSHIFPLNSDARYFIQINFFYLAAKYYIFNNDFKNYINIKNRWINYVIDHSKNENDIFISKYYKSNFDKFYNNISEVKYLNKFKNEEYYIYGPNSQIVPSTDKSNVNLILTKYPIFEVQNFRSITLFLNSYSSNQLTPEMYNELFDKYELVLKNETLQGKAKILLANPESEMASSMGLNRILRHLILTDRDKRYSVKLDGFDLYTKSNVFSGKILSAVSEMNTIDQNEMVLTALWQHDFIYNFLELKDLLLSFDIVESAGVLEIVNLDLEQYWNSVIGKRLMLQ
jgi:hypothetical protein